MRVGTRLYELCFALGELSPQNEHEVLSMGSQGSNTRIGKPFPSQAFVRAGGTGSNGQHTVEQQYSLARPMGKVTVGACGRAGGRDISF